MLARVKSVIMQQRLRYMISRAGNKFILKKFIFSFAAFWPLSSSMCVIKDLPIVLNKSQCPDRL